MEDNYNHRHEENIFNKWKTKEERIMRENGINEEKIQKLREFDREQFNSNRRFLTHYYFDSDSFFSKYDAPAKPQESLPQSVEEFLNCISSIALVEALKEFGFETQLIVFLRYRGFTGRQVSKITGIPTYTISRRISELEKVYKQKSSTK